MRKLNSSATYHNISLYSFFVCSCIVFLFVFFSVCSLSEQNPVLIRADLLMKERPDSALAILKSISALHQFSQSDSALYALLLTQAQYENYTFVGNDSLIRMAVNYYGSRKKSFRASQAHYYLGLIYKNMGNTPFAVREYLQSIRLMPVENEFLAMIYYNLAECYKDSELYNDAMVAYRKAFYILEDADKQVIMLKGIASIFMLQHQRDSALCYFRRILDYALEQRNDSLKSILNYDLAIVYEQDGDYIQAEEYISRMSGLLDLKILNSISQTKGNIMLGLHDLDSAQYYFNKYKDSTDIYGKIACYGGLYQVEKMKGNWRAAVRYADIYMILYDSIQGLSNIEEIVHLIDKYQLETYEQGLSQRIRLQATVWTVVFLGLVVTVYFLWNSKKRNHNRALAQRRVEIAHQSNAVEKNDKSKFVELGSQQIQRSIQIFQATDCYQKLCMMEKSTFKKRFEMKVLVPSINKTIRNVFVDVMANLKECCPTLTENDLFYCVLSLLHYPKDVIIELMDVSSDALKTRKSRIKSKMCEDLFNHIFSSDN